MQPVKADSMSERDQQRHAYQSSEIVYWTLLCRLRQLQQPSEVCRYLRHLHNGHLTLYAQSTLVACLREAAGSPYPPGASYCSRLCRAAMSAAEVDLAEVQDELADLYMLFSTGDCAQGLTQSAEGWCYKTYAYDASTGLTLETRRSVGQSGLITLKLATNLFEGGTGCHEWEAGFFLAEFVLSHPDIFKGSSCLELGCGAGVVGVALCRSGAGKVQLTDGNDAAVDNCQHNLEINNCIPPQHCATQLAGNTSQESQDVQVMQMQWESPCKVQPDLILAADVLYDPATIVPLVLLLRRLLCNADANCAYKPTAFIATTLRNKETLRQFLCEAEGSQLIVDDISAQARQMGVNFQHYTALETQRNSIFLHKIVLRDEFKSLTIPA